MNAPDLLAEFASRHGLGAMMFSDEGTAQFVTDSLVVNLEYVAGARSLHLYASLGEPPLENREECYATLLEANLFGRDTGGATAGFDRDHTELLLTRTIDPDTTDYPAFESAVEGLIEAARRLRGAVASTPAAEAETADAAADLFSPNPMFRV